MSLLGYESIKIASLSDVINLNMMMNETLKNINLCENERDKYIIEKKLRKVLMKKKKDI
jgi:hypothetical protein